jgi:hypothetical protein
MKTISIRDDLCVTGEWKRGGNGFEGVYAYCCGKHFTIKIRLMTHLETQHKVNLSTCFRVASELFDNTDIKAS